MPALAGAGNSGQRRPSEVSSLELTVADVASAEIDYVALAENPTYPRCYPSTRVVIMRIIEAIFAEAAGEQSAPQFRPAR